jgi:predicted hydrocarbon binding protein
LEKEFKFSFRLPFIETTADVKRVRVLFRTKEPLNNISPITDLLNRMEEKGFRAHDILIQRDSENKFLGDVVLDVPSGMEDRFSQEIQQLFTTTADTIDYEYTINTATNGLIYDHLLEKIFLGNNERAIIFSDPNIQGIFVRIREDYGELGKILLERLGFYVGSEFAKIYREKTRDIETALKFLIYGGVSKGNYSLKELKTVKTPEGFYSRIVIENHVEEEALRKEGIADCSVYQLGVFKGFIKEYFRLEELPQDAVQQIKCTGKGDEYSVFTISLNLQET